MSFGKSLLVAAVAIALLAVAVTACTHICKDITVDNVPGCSLKGKGCKCVFHHKYDVSLTDPVSGASGDSGYMGDETLAGETAVFQVLLNDRGCNCKSEPSIPLGNCTIKASGCFYFASVAALQAKQAALRLYAQVLTPSASPEFSAVVTNATTANVEAAALQLLLQIESFNGACAPKVAAERNLAASRLGAELAPQINGPQVRLA